MVCRLVSRHAVAVVSSLLTLLSRDLGLRCCVVAGGYCCHVTLLLLFRHFWHFCRVIWAFAAVLLPSPPPYAAAVIDCGLVAVCAASLRSLFVVDYSGLLQSVPPGGQGGMRCMGVHFAVVHCMLRRCCCFASVGDGDGCAHNCDGRGDGRRVMGVMAQASHIFRQNWLKKN
eukprot:scaffold78290_cov44-Cyclotella_meneghiniana.AAC.3